MAMNENTYFSEEASRAFMSVSQFKNFQKCEAAALAELNGVYVPERGRALILGSYVDEMLTGTKESCAKFVEENRAELFKKNGEPYADVAQASETIIRVQNQPEMMKYLDGEHQVIMTGEIEGVPFKIKMDSYKSGEFIADLKYMASLRSPNLFQPMISYWGYDFQAACYQEVVRQNTGEQLPFLFVVATKEKPAHLAVGKISQWNMDEALETVRKKIKRFQAIKNGEIKPERCEDYGCDYCTTTNIITEPIDTDMFGMNREQIRIAKGEV
jgi:hypothetical protein